MNHSKKRTILCCGILATTCVLTLSVKANACCVSPWYLRQQTAHNIAEEARSLGCSETDPIIVRAQQLWNDAQQHLESDCDIVTVVVFNEAGYGCSSRHQDLVAAVVVNRSVMGFGNDSTIYDVVTHPGQYLKAYATPGSKYWNKAFKDPVATAACKTAAMRALTGQVDCPNNLLYQSNFRQGDKTYEVCKTSYSSTYFCLG